MKFLLLLILAIALPACTGCSTHRSRAKAENIFPPVAPLSNIWPLNDAHWLDQKIWPQGLTNNSLTYNLVIELKDRTSTVVTSFQAAHTSGKRYSAFYRLDEAQLNGSAKNLFTDKGQVFYGPCFEWLPDGRLRSKQFHHGNGLKEHHWLDAQGNPVWSDYSNSNSNRYWIFRYDAQGGIQMRGTGRDDPTLGFQGGSLFLINDRPVKTEAEFLHRANTYRRNEIIGNEGIKGLGSHRSF